MANQWSDKLKHNTSRCETRFPRPEAFDKPRPGEYKPRNKNLSEPLSESFETRYNNARAAWVAKHCR